jgi:hypothetical protein
MILLGISLSFLFGYFWVFFFKYLEKTRMHRAERHVNKSIVLQALRIISPVARTNN